ncbi:uroporphyrinogen-III synthase [Sinorhizobium meliloti]|uniref:uroporphyrinogen-III synthase n=1 Tax=Rhizobium meliloti TaxID=382 RepID=UPI000FDBFE67|nr:uroporphyrinogen-III synthase [Sinorhizobium meliloti]MDW9685814.1 uroporphyrinogen-III synthase [Sinorhizobium meliloti]MDX0132154.1 uroporphyrinogen-III synthase [Sinorhizobium meliloti]RVI82918.1 uroporphyrinogen-III synthase [Sinorhizobium meliloti]RVI91672.1 uroporphyrinogen-III synthase [Sinorhizobium meliloti]RVP03176.1 uroporphyrinogen-III synthase [Sinorhizobium meliloti]
MRVLVTRPRPAAERTAARLSAMGHEAVILPLMQAQHLAGAARAALSEPHQAIAVSSGEAVRVLGALGPALEPHVATPLFAVGEATARAAGDLGFTDVRIGPGTGEGLAETVAALLPPGETLVYLAGSPRTDGFERALHQRRIEHRTAECYRMAPVHYPAETLPGLLRAGPFDAVMLYSRESARRLDAALRESGLEPADLASRFLCLSWPIRETLPDGLPCGVAAVPDEENLLRLL